MRVVDLFCGCGGLSLGARRAGFEIALSIDVDRTLTASYGQNFGGQANLKIADVADIDGRHLRRELGNITGIIGGPPCQGFSEVGLAKMDDPRRQHLNHFFRIVSEANPEFFLMENVRGLTFKKNIFALQTAMAQLGSKYHIVGPVKLNSSDFGAATTRPRIFVFGLHSKYADKLSLSDIYSAKRAEVTVREAFSDLSGSRFSHIDTFGFDAWRYGRRKPSLYAQMLRSKDGIFTGARCVAHRQSIVDRFALVRPGGIDTIGRHPRLHWDRPSPTLRAGTGAERGSFQAVRPLHPEDPRVISVREAARLQGFPDEFVFHPTTWHSFRMIGNSVSPIVAEALLGVLASKTIAKREKGRETSRFEPF